MTEQAANRLTNLIAHPAVEGAHNDAAARDSEIERIQPANNDILIGVASPGLPIVSEYLPPQGW